LCVQDWSYWSSWEVWKGHLFRHPGGLRPLLRLEGDWTFFAGFAHRHPDFVGLFAGSGGSKLVGVPVPNAATHIVLTSNADPHANVDPDVVGSGTFGRNSNYTNFTDSCKILIPEILKG